MSSQSISGSSASNTQNPFLQPLNQDSSSSTYVSDVPLRDNSGAGSTGQSLNELSGGQSATSTSSTDADAAARKAQAQVGQAKQGLQQGIANLTDGQTKKNLAGDLAPNPETVSQPAPEGTEHVTTILGAIGGAFLSAPAAALEAVSPVAASKVSDAAHAISAKLPNLSLQDATATAQNAANAAYSKLPQGTADTIRSYVGAAQAKAAEVLPPALGGSPTRGNVGSGDLAKPPSQLASEYASAAQRGASNAAATAQQSASNAAATAQAYAGQALGSAKQTAQDASAVTQQKASEAAQATRETAQNASAITQQKASQAAEATRQTAYDASAITQQKASQAAEATRQTAYDASNVAQQKSSEAAQATRETAQDASSRASYAADEASRSAQQQQSSYGQSTQQSSYGQSTQQSYGQPTQSYSTTSSSLSQDQSAGDLLNRAAATNTYETTHSGLSSNNPYSSSATTTTGGVSTVGSSGTGQYNHPVGSATTETSVDEFLAKRGYSAQ